MKWNVEVEGRVRERYEVECDTAEEAAYKVEMNAAGEPWFSEVDDAEIVNVTPAIEKAKEA